MNGSTHLNSVAGASVLVIGLGPAGEINVSTGADLVRRIVFDRDEIVHRLGRRGLDIASLESLKPNGVPTLLELVDGPVLLLILEAALPKTLGIPSRETRHSKTPSFPRR